MVDALADDGARGGLDALGARKDWRAGGDPSSGDKVCRSGCRAAGGDVVATAEAGAAEAGAGVACAGSEGGAVEGGALVGGGAACDAAACDAAACDAAACGAVGTVAFCISRALRCAL